MIAEEQKQREHRRILAKQIRKSSGYRASHPGKPESYYRRLNTPKAARAAMLELKSI